MQLAPRPSIIRGIRIGSNIGARGASAGRTAVLGLVGVIGGLMSGLFGVGGGIVIVPLLLLWCGYGAREATGTSLAVIVVTSVIGAASQQAYGNVDVANAALVGLPAVGGVLAGTWLQQRIAPWLLTRGFALVLVVVAVQLAVS
jgi:uncharacterized membrane protein YfcA